MSARLLRFDCAAGALQAREFLYWKLNGRQVVSPVAIMTSDAKGNHQRVQQILAGFNWFGRGQNSFRCMSCLSVLTLHFESQSRLLLQQRKRPCCLVKPLSTLPSIMDTVVVAGYLLNVVMLLPDCASPRPCSMLRIASNDSNACAC